MENSSLKVKTCFANASQFESLTIVTSEMHRIFPRLSLSTCPFLEETLSLKQEVPRNHQIVTRSKKDRSQNTSGSGEFSVFSIFKPMPSAFSNCFL